MKMPNRYVATFLVWIFAAAIAFGQSASPTPPNATNSVPPTMQWFFFLSTVDHTERASAKLEIQGKDGTGLRNEVQKGLGFTDQQFVPIRETAVRLMAEFRALNAQIQAVVVLYRQSLAQGSAAPTGSDAYKAQWSSLLQQRETLVQSEVANLHTALGPELSASVDAYIKNNMAHNITTSHPKGVTP